MVRHVALEPVTNVATDWGDCGNDWYLDLFLTGHANCCGRISRIYRNQGGGSFVDIGAGLQGVYFGSVAWGDYDGDGDLDILLTGLSNCCGRISRIYRNQGGGSFVDIAAGLPGVYQGTGIWGDYDNDGDLDFLLAGDVGGVISYIYRNTAGSFNLVASLDGMTRGSAAWGDYDGDGDLDLLMTGQFSCCFRYSRIYRNNGGNFSDLGGLGLEPVFEGSSTWGDYDGDGDLDILLTGVSNCCGQISRVYRNQAGTFVDISTGLVGVSNSSGSWGDYDNDGDSDILLTGDSNSFGRISRVYRNQAGAFTDTEAGLMGISAGPGNWADYDNDNDLDILLVGNSNSGSLSWVYRNNA